MTAGQSSRHIEALQSLRGIAALVVAVSHLSTFYEIPTAIRLTIDTVLNAHASVVVFYVLSGFVLTGSLVRSGLNPPSIKSFYLRRLYRLIPAMWVVTLISLALLMLLPPLGPRPKTSEWLESSNFGLPTPLILVASFLALKNNLIMPIWTVFIEFVASLFMPIFVAAAVHFRRALIPIVAVTGATPFVMAGWPHRLNSISDLWFFLLGVAVALSAPTVRAPRSSAFIALAGLIFFRGVLHYSYTGHVQSLSYGYMDPLPAVVEGLTAAVLISIIAQGKDYIHLLRHDASVWLGDISYSLYLVHFPIGLATAKLISSFFPQISAEQAALLMLGGALPTSILVSHALYRLIELPFIRLGSRNTTGARPDDTSPKKEQIAAP